MEEEASVDGIPLNTTMSCQLVSKALTFKAIVITIRREDNDLCTI